MDWKHLLAYITGTVDQELLLRNEYLVTENRMLRNQITGRVRLTDAERKTLAEIGHKLSKQALAEVATIVKPDTILGWHRTLVAQKFDGSQQRQSPGRGIGKSNGLFHRPRLPTPCHPAAILPADAHAWGRPARPAPAAGQRWIPPAGRRLAPQRTDRMGGWGRAACTAGAARGAAARG